MKAAIQAKLELEWSPAQIAAWLREDHPDRPTWHVCHETIYQSLYHGARSGLSRRLTKKLRTGRPLRKRRRSPAARSPRFVAPGQLIHARPAVAWARTRIGDWEGDLITGRGNRSAIGTLVCRTSRYIKLVHLPDGRTAEQLRDALHLTLLSVPAAARRSLVWDQGSEMACHDQIAELFLDGVFFAEPGKPWQRPTNENSNGLLRQYFPRGTDLAVHTRADLDAVEERINNRPRKTLGWRSPAQVFQTTLVSTPAVVLRR